MADPSTTHAAPLTADIDHIALHCTQSPLILTTFYTDVLGFTPVNLDAYTSGKVPFPAVRISPITIIDFMPPSPTDPPTTPALSRGTHLCLSLSPSHYQALKIRLSHHGVEYTREKTLSGARGHAPAIYLSDPDGNTLEFRSYPPTNP